MQLGFVSAILHDFPLEDVFSFASHQGFECVELMCWPPGGADRRYAGVTHVDVTRVDAAESERIRDLANKYGVAISGLGYYPNPLDADAENRKVYVEHLKKVIDAAAMLGVGIVNTFIGRDPFRSVPATWPVVEQVWPEIVRHAVRHQIKLAIENCPMLFSLNEWPGGKNLPVSPALWRKLFDIFPALGLNFDPSHLIWQMIDPARAIREFGKRIVHFHAKDMRIDQDRLYEEGILGLGWHVPKLPGLGDVKWGEVFAALNESGYNGAICIEVEDRAFEGSVNDRKRALIQSRRYLRQFMS